MKNQTERSFNLLGGTVVMIVYDVDDTLANHLLDILGDEGKRLQAIFNFYDPKSELSTLNRKRRANVSDELLLVIKTALEYSEKTNGQYDVTRGKYFLARKRGEPFQEPKCSWTNINVIGNIVQLNNQDVMIDLGSIAKGYIADRLLDKMKELGIESGYIDARGEIGVFGNKMEIVHVQHPRKQDETMHPIFLMNGCVATSGDYVQYASNFKESHILGSKGTISCTVIADSLMKADALATCLFVLDMDAARELAIRENVRALIVDREERVHTINGFEELEVKS